jgi:hypothetical protein
MESGERGLARLIFNFVKRTQFGMNADGAEAYMDIDSAPVQETEEEIPLSPSELYGTIARDVEFYRSEGVNFEAKGGVFTLQAGPVEWKWVDEKVKRKNKRVSLPHKTHKILTAEVGVEPFMEAIQCIVLGGQS